MTHYVAIVEEEDGEAVGTDFLTCRAVSRLPTA